MNNFFKVLHKSSHLHQGYGGQAKSKARLGEIDSDHGNMKTPGFISAATKGTIKTLTPQQIKDIGIQGACVNTYHLVTHPGTDVIERAGGIQKYSGLNIFTMSDSGGFQVFSLAREQRKANVRGEEQPLVVKISEDGVKFRSSFDGELIEFTPERSMEFQRQIGADINMAFDECTYYPSTHKYAEKAMERTHRWLKRCIKYVGAQFIAPKNKGLINQTPTRKQYLYGVIQGGTFEDLRKKSAEFVVSQNTPGVAIGGVSVGETKKEMREQVKWVSDYLPKDRPVHLLGVGQIDDIIDLVKYGVDTFDCVEPTRLARMGTLYKISNIKSQITNKYQIINNKIQNEEINITKTIYRNNFEKVDEDCNCYVCQNFTKSYLHHLFKQREILGYTLATFHNLWVMEKLFEEIREMIVKDLI
ncbi:MAG: tRNA guanosine(34) transglycosylase Tgt [Candidatus Roizmanbacteria bacterium]|nr:tRNA guanosine(34) transglycosylase Tgt [Candidatus Roizmanbacteria bacterium]